MRIIGGKHKRKRFDVPKSFNARPTTDFAKENLFNVLSHRIELEDIRALDLFSGTGSIALELVSRGVESVVAVEQRREHAAFIRSCSKQLDETDAGRVRVLQTDAFRFVRQGVGVHGSFDLIFADPPYKLSEIAMLPQKILESGLLCTGGILIVEHPKDYDFSSLEWFSDHRAYGSVNFSIFTLSAAEEKPLEVRAISLDDNPIIQPKEVFL